MNNIILIDDDLAFCESFKNIAKTRNINITSRNSLEGLKQLLPSLAHKYAAVVLDIKCLISDDQAIEDASFIPAALSYLDSNVTGFKRFILTGDESEFDILKPRYKNENIFLKKPDDQEKLLNELDYCVLNANNLMLMRENPLIFEVFDNNFLPRSKEPKILNILSNYNQKNPLHFTGIIGDIREVHEEIYKAINSRNPTVVPNQFINGNGSPIFNRGFYNHMLGNLDSTNSYRATSPIYQDSTINSSTKFIHQTSSEFLHGSSSSNYQINHYTVKSLINSLMELILWSRQF